MKLTSIALALAGVIAAPAASAAAPADAALPEMTVTGTREGELLSETPATVGIVKDTTLRETRPTHPKEVLNQVPGVWVSNLSGEGHSTAIRQPLTTSAVYLYLEDGIPTRSTGFFNHNALYEINVPQAGGMEIMKGPGSALYGSDAIGGTINVLTRTPPTKAEFEASAEAGSHGWGRVLVGGGNAHGDDAWRASLNLTRTDGWQDNAGYDRQTGTARWDRLLGDDALLKTVLSFSKVDQQHVGKLSAGELEATPRANNVPFSYREVDAFRLSTAYEKETANSLLSITPYFRDNSMDILPNWSVSYDPSRYLTKNKSFGLLGKYRRDFEPLRARLIVGLDFDYSPGSRDEDSIRLDKTTNAYGGVTYSLNPAAPVQIYDYDVSYRGISPYVHGEASLTERLRVNAGLRYDDMRYDYENNFNGGVAGATQGVAGPFPAGGWYGHVASTEVGYTHWGPKLGATYAFSEALSGFAAYSNSFRAPSESQVFRGSRESTAAKAQAAAESLLDLKPVIVDNYELGLRGKAGTVRYEASVYHMVKKDDIVSYTDPATTQRTVVNAGETLHRGVELGLGLPLAPAWQLDASLSYAKHTYESWTVSGTADYSGNEMEAAPRLIANTRLSYAPGFMNGGRVQLEWFRLGSYWLDAANTGKYDGHDLFNLRANYPFGKGMEVFGSITNLFDKRYAETADGTGTAPTYTAGLPRSAVVGVQAKW
ncbi:putative TonB-dependent receptor [Thiobacillus denitrificans ATCC 25259]|uniref:Putative TonB-dependent receptor n=1 Tax=Thiobacillus denitrificans (strain ATCC 25259 / T1) TaxID=292415 RepID=Q3SKC5_THIDA|nr:TonB-dependent receptor [Thiobacillus denitrificans]AAZ96862.1 putative TonB-dependent receptor [Thiobacillus denitrificans ATCC 25259]